MTMINFDRIDSNITVWMTIDGQEYELSQFRIGFAQASDHKGEPQDEVRGGLMQLTLTQTLPESMYSWAMKSITKEGNISFKIESGSSPLKIEFSNAYCVGFKRVVSSNGEGVSTALTVSPEELRINGISFDNRWVK
ncbi:MAG TPA: type VI secretion system needle protein Hcp [Candidatus Atribacteria bacterium]|nr:type VI secretion system needle protein Hcp [Candidatus Atribacteria bacterium]